MSAAHIQQALILAGGLGTRFRAVSADKPKGLADVGGKPVVERQIEALREAGVRRVVLCVGHLADAVEAHFGDGRRLGVEVAYSREKDLRGTAGAMLLARDLLHAGAFFAMNGDAFIEGLRFATLGEFHLGRLAHDRRTAATIVAIRPPDAGAYGVLDVNTTDGRLIKFREKAPLDPSDPAALVNAGVYVLEPNLFFPRVPAGRPVSIEYEAFPACIAAGDTLWVHKHAGFFGDIGTPEGYSRVQARILQRDDSPNREAE